MSEPTPGPDRRAILQQALRAVEDAQARLAASDVAKREPIAIVGMGCRFPGGADDPERCWDLLREGRDATRDVPADRWDADAYYDPDPEAVGKMITRRGGFLDRVDLFDPAFFGISPREAQTLDPQQRLLLEVAFEALEDGGLAPDQLRGSQTGVFVGITTSDYAKVIGAGEAGQTDVYAATGNALNAAAGRLSFVLGLHGPCAAVDTACSSSLTAIHLACQSLRNGECDLALAGGVNVVLLPDAAVLFSKWGMLAPDGRCKTFDAGADGFVRAEGCGVLALKRLSVARAAGDRILALIRGSAVSQDGASSGLTVPNGPAQQMVIRAALERAGVAPADVDYVEAHGTGTPLGDPIEVEALAAVMDPGRPADRPLLIGSIKTNLGHTEAASGVAGLIKVVQALRHEALPAHLHLKELNPRIPWADYKIAVPTALRPWPRGERRRLAGVSSFGFSGTNAHVVLEEAPRPEERPAAGAERPMHLLALSGRNEAALRAVGERLSRHLEEHPEQGLGDVAHTANTGRAHLAHRAAVLVQDAEGARERLLRVGGEDDGAAGVVRGRAVGGEGPRIAFLFTGQGSQYVGMGRHLYETQPTFRKALDRCAEILGGRLERPLLDVTFGAPSCEGLIDRTLYTQPCLFSLEWALSELWRSWGVEPRAVLGHSIGEFVAATVAGVLTLEDALGLVAERARLMEAQPLGGEMAAVHASEARVRSALAQEVGEVSIAAVNGPESVVLSGAGSALRRVLASLEGEGVKSQALVVSHAFHSPLMDPMLGALETAAQGVAHGEPQLDLVSNLTGKLVGREDLGPAYWRQHARGAVRYWDGLEELRGLGYDVFVEVGPAPVLIGMGQRGGSESKALWVPSLRKGRDDWGVLLEGLARLWVKGTKVDWRGFDRDYPRKRVSLPTSPFQRSRFWVERDARPPAGRRPGAHRLLGQRVDLSSASDVRLFEGEIGIPLFPYLKDHRVQHGAVVPATAWTEMALEAFVDTHGAGPMVLEGIDYLKPLFPGEETRYAVQVVLTGKEAASRFEVSSRPLVGDAAPAEPWIRHVTGRIRRGEAAAGGVSVAEREEIRAACPEEVAGAEFYRLLRERGNDWGPMFQGLKRVFRGSGVAWSEVVAPEGPGMDLHGYEFHPALADAAGHVLVATAPLKAAGGPRSGAFVGGAIDEIRLYGRPRGRKLVAEARLRSGASDDANLLVGDVRVFDEDGTLVSELRGARLWYLDDDAVGLRRADVGDRLFEVDWRVLPLDAAPAQSPSRPGFVVVAGGPLATRLAARLAERDVECRTVGTEAGQVAERLDAVLSELGERCGGVLFHDATSSGEAGLTAVRASGLDVALGVAQVCIKRTAAVAPRLWFATTGAQPVGGPPTSPLGAAIWGLGRALALEHPDTWGGLIDLDPAATPDASSAHLAARVLAAGGEDQVAFRGDACFGARLVASGNRGSSVALRADATYLVTGGRGGLGLEVARSLAQRGARRIVLLGRTPPPPREEWAALAGREDGPGRLVATLLEIEACGATVFPAAVDVSDREQLATWYGRFRREAWPPLRGVVHAAGALRHCAVLDEDEAGLESVLGAKVDGALFLNDLLAREPLDFFVLFSSASAILSSPRLGAYAAANAALDAFAHQWRSLGRPALSINWGVWGEAGMVKQFDAADVAAVVQRGMGALTTAEGLEALWRLVGGEAAQSAVLPVDWVQWSRRYPALAGAPFLREVTAASPAASEGTSSVSARDAILAAAPAERDGLLSAFVGSQVGRVLGLPPDTLDLQQPLRTLGLDSLMAVEIRNRLQANLGVSLPLAVLLEGPSAAQLVVRLLPMLSSGPAPVTPPAEARIDARKAATLLDSLDGLGEGDVDALLGQMLAEGPGPREGRS